MNCHEFNERMQDRLDQRLSLDDDVELDQHAEVCEACRKDMQAWQLIATSISNRFASSARPQSNVRIRYPSAIVDWTVPTIAAVLMLAVATQFWRGTTEVAELGAASNSSVLRDATSVDLESVSSISSPDDRQDRDTVVDWWPQIDEAVWLDRAMPTVKSVQQGVAPLGRSLMRALTMLTIGNRNSTS